MCQFRSVSVIIPTRNRPQRLKALLRSLESQVIDPDIQWEAIIVDDGSTIESRAASERYLDGWTASPLHFIALEKRGGVSRARNTGVERSGGQILVFLDDDLVVESDVLQKIVQVHSDHPEILVLNGLLRKMRDDYLSNFWQHYYSAAFDRVCPSPYRISRVASGHFSIKRALLERVFPLFDDSLPAREDFDLFLRLREMGIPAFKDDRIIAYHDFRRTLVSLVRQRLWYERGELALRQKHGEALLREFYRSEPPVARKWKLVPINLILLLTRKIYRLRLCLPPAP